MDDYLSILVTVYVAVIGLLVGSFLNVCICRFPLGETVVKGRSVCRSCSKTIAWYDNIPVFSFLILRGRCRRCGARFSARYPAVELSNALLWLLAYGTFGLSFRTLLLCLAASALLIAAFIDLDTRSVPDRLSVFLALLGGAGFFLDPTLIWWERLVGALVVSLPMLLLACLFDGFGGADIKLCAACGLLIGWQAMLAAFLFAAVPAAVYGVCLRLLKKAGPKAAFPFVPFLSAGVFFAALYAGPLIDWYLSFF